MITEKKMIMQEAGLDIIDFSVEETAGHTGEVTNLGDSEDDLGEDSEGVAQGVTDRPPTTILPGKMVMKIMIRDMDFIINQINDPETPVNGNTIYTTPSKVKMERRQRTSRMKTTSPLVPPLLRSTE